MTKNINGISVRTNLKAGEQRFPNHNETLLREAAGRSLKVRTHLKAGATLNHNETLVSGAAGRGL